MNMNKSNQVNREKASSHPLQPGGVYVGIVRATNNGRPTIFVPQLGCTYNNVEYLGNTTTNQLLPNDRVLCTFTDLESSDIYVLGAFNKKLDVFASKTELTSLAARVAALEANSHTHS